MFKSKLMQAALTAVACASCASCASDPVVTPYAYEPVASGNPAEMATVWGGGDGAGNLFSQIDGHDIYSLLHSYPLAVTLPPGPHSIKLLYASVGLRAESIMHVEVKAGHTYSVRNFIRNVDGRAHWEPVLNDLGTGVVCQFGHYDKPRIDVRLICQ